MTHWTLTSQALAAAIQRDDHNHSAVLMPDGETVVAPDEDLGFTVSLKHWIAAGGRALGEDERYEIPSRAPTS